MDVIVGVASNAISALPFGEPIAALIQDIYDRAQTARTNAENCANLVKVPGLLCSALVI